MWRLGASAVFALGCGRIHFAVDAVDAEAATLDASDPALRVWLPMEDGIVDRAITDASGHGHDARCVQGAECPAETTGVFGIGLTSFSNAAPGLELDDPSQELKLTTTFTLAAWLRWNGAAAFSAVIERPVGPASENSYELEITSAGVLNCEVDGSGLTRTAVDTTTFPIDAWTHVACTHDGQRVELYRGGQLVDSNVTGYVPDYDDHKTLVGVDQNSGNPANFFSGTIDDVRIYNVILDATAISILASR